MITKATTDDYAEIIDLWEHSVRATHHFLPEEYLQQIKTMLPSILPHVNLYISRTATGNLSGFLGVAENKIEMLFIHPSNFGSGIGKLLAHFAIKDLQADKVDVNEQNERATEFYKHIGFVVTGRTETDGLGKPFPLIQMELPKSRI